MAVQCSAVQCSAVQCSAVQCNDSLSSFFFLIGFSEEKFNYILLRLFEQIILFQSQEDTNIGQ
jgi:hypothetical protein